jgi:hypothetical protein
MLTTDREHLRENLRELLPGMAHFDVVFRQEAHLRPALLRLTDDPFVSLESWYVLALIGEPEDMRYLIRTGIVLNGGWLTDTWRGFAAAALIQPETDVEWAFLEHCVKRQELGCAKDAIRSLRLNGSARAAKILTGTGTVVNREPIRDTNLELLARRVAHLVGERCWQSNDKPVFNETGDKAMVAMGFAPSDSVTWIAAFYKSGDEWVLRGARPTVYGFGSFACREP